MPRRIKLLSIQRYRRRNPDRVYPRNAAKFLGSHVRIWSAEHRAWWCWHGHGYTSYEAHAGVYKFEDAVKRTQHCGPEKKIEYFLVSDPLVYAIGPCGALL